MLIMVVCPRNPRWSRKPAAGERRGTFVEERYAVVERIVGLQGVVADRNSSGVPIPNARWGETVAFAFRRGRGASGVGLHGIDRSGVLTDDLIDVRRHSLCSRNGLLVPVTPSFDRQGSLLAWLMTPPAWPQPKSMAWRNRAALPLAGW